MYFSINKSIDVGLASLESTRNLIAKHAVCHRRAPDRHRRARDRHCKARREGHFDDQAKGVVIAKHADRHRRALVLLIGKHAGRRELAR